MTNAIEETPAVTVAPVRQQVFNIAVHEADMARRKAAREARRDEMLKNLDGRYAAAREMEKPVFKFRVEASWGGVRDGGRVMLHCNEVIAAQNEADAWAQCCDRIGAWPSVQSVKRTITRLEQVSVTEAVSGVDPNDQDLPVVTLVPLRKPGRI